MIIYGDANCRGKVYCFQDYRDIEKAPTIDQK